MIAFACGAADRTAPAGGTTTITARSADARDAPACAEVIAHLTTLGRAGARDVVHGEDDAAWLEGYLARQAERFTRECSGRPWSERYRACLAGASDDAALRTCDREDRLARGDDLGGASCEEVGLHFAQILATEPPPPPHRDDRPVPPERIARNAEAMAIVCENAGWTRTVKACMLRATNGDGLRDCQSR